MTRLRPLLGLGVLLAGCHDSGPGDEGARTDRDERDDRDRAAAVAVVAEDLEVYPRAQLRDDEEAACVAGAIVDGVGLERLAEVGLDVDAGTPPRLWRPEITEAEGRTVYAAYDGCLDLAGGDVEAYMADGLDREQAECASDAYRSSGIPQVHSVEPLHTDDPTRAAAHGELEAFIEATKAACRAWIAP